MSTKPQPEKRADFKVSESGKFGRFVIGDVTIRRRIRTKNAGRHFIDQLRQRKTVGLGILVDLSYHVRNCGLPDRLPFAVWFRLVNRMYCKSRILSRLYRITKRIKTYLDFPPQPACCDGTTNLPQL